MRKLLLSIAVVSVFGCASTQVMRTDLTPRAAKSPEQVVFLTEVPDRPFTVVALLKVSDQGWGMDTSKILLKKAAELGGDAVLITGESQSMSAGASSGGGVTTAVVVPVKDTSARVIVFKKQS